MKPDIALRSGDLQKHLCSWPRRHGAIGPIGAKNQTHTLCSQNNMTRWQHREMPFVEPQRRGRTTSVSEQGYRLVN